MFLGIYKCQAGHYQVQGWLLKISFFNNAYLACNDFVCKSSYQKQFKSLTRSGMISWYFGIYLFPEHQTCRKIPYHCYLTDSPNTMQLQANLNFSCFWHINLPLKLKWNIYTYFDAISLNAAEEYHEIDRTITKHNCVLFCRPYLSMQSL